MANFCVLCCSIEEAIINGAFWFSAGKHYKEPWITSCLFRKEIRSSCFFSSYRYPNKYFLHHKYSKKAFYDEFDLQGSFVAFLWINEFGDTCKTRILMALKSRSYIFYLDCVKSSLRFFFILNCSIKSFTQQLSGTTFRDEHEYSNIGIFEYFGARINICIRFHDKVHIRIYSNICSVLWIYSNNTECFEQTGCMSYGPKILTEHSSSLVYHVYLVK